MLKDPPTLEVTLAPAEFQALPARDLSRTTCVVFDVLRATSTMITALGHGAAAIIPVAGIAEAVRLRQAQPAILLAGERDGVRIPASLTGGIDFDLGNSPREFTRERVEGRTIAMSTTNGTRALRACAGARQVWICSFLNLKATAERLAAEGASPLLLVCAGTVEEAAYEDVLGAGALCDLLWPEPGAHSPAAGRPQGTPPPPGPVIADSALLARRLFALEAPDLAAAFRRSRNGRRLLTIEELRDDVAFCAQRDCVNLAAAMDRDGKVRVL
jgi:2-phosphosulfolactate phosphatase